MKHRIKRARTVMEALPYIMKFHGEVIVIKYGGAAMVDQELKNSVMRDVVLLKYVGMHPVIVHGGGPAINKYLKRKNIKTSFVNGQRVTDREVLSAVTRVLGHKINGNIIKLIKKNGGRAKGFFGKKGEVLKAGKLVEKGVDLGFTGEVTGVRCRFLLKWMKKGYVPVLAPIGVGRGGQLYNINADRAAASIAAHLKATKLILMTDVRGVLDSKGKLVSSINSYRINEMIKEGQLSGGMIPKVKSGLYAMRKGVEKVHIIDGRILHALLLEIFTDVGIGTMVVK
ncbi:MAG: acetylglutamate kinase, partial [Candidatus Saganbacteria bacterium]|nr:acetylglutamate kinase [Candidatus Saganbacteria bacterium]